MSVFTSSGLQSPLLQLSFPCNTFGYINHKYSVPSPTHQDVSHPLNTVSLIARPRHHSPDKSIFLTTCPRWQGPLNIVSQTTQHWYQWVLITLSFPPVLLFAMMPESSINSWMSWFILTCEKYKQLSMLQLRSHTCIVMEVANCRKVAYVAMVLIFTVTGQQCIMVNVCTYLNIGLLVAPRQYVLHGLVLVAYWTRLWPLLASMYLVATPDPVCAVYSCYWQRFKFHPNVFCPLGWLLTNVQVNITTSV